MPSAVCALYQNVHTRVHGWHQGQQRTAVVRGVFYPLNSLQ